MWSVFVVPFLTLMLRQTDRPMLSYIYNYKHIPSPTQLRIYWWKALYLYLLFLETLPNRTPSAIWSLRQKAAHSVDKLPMSGRARRSNKVFSTESNLGGWDWLVRCLQVMMPGISLKNLTPWKSNGQPTIFLEAWGFRVSPFLKKGVLSSSEKKHHF